MSWATAKVLLAGRHDARRGCGRVRVRVRRCLVTPPDRAASSIGAIFTAQQLPGRMRREGGIDRVTAGLVGCVIFWERDADLEIGDVGLEPASIPCGAPAQAPHNPHFITGAAEHRGPVQPIWPRPRLGFSMLVREAHCAWLKHAIYRQWSFIYTALMHTAPSPNAYHQCRACSPAYSS